MTTNTSDTPDAGVVDRIDLSTYIGPLDVEPEPKTLEECLAEAGGVFPFVARAIIPYEGPNIPIPVGTEWKFTKWLGNYMIGPESFDHEMKVDAKCKRWVLVGHKT